MAICAADRSQYLTVAKAFGLNIVQLKKDLDGGNTVTRRGLSLDEAADIMQRLREVGAAYQVKPDPLDRYPEILDCDLR